MEKTLILKCCPFCGGKAFWRKGNKLVRMNDNVTCHECFAEIEGDYTPMSALEPWNRRTADNSKNDREVTIGEENL